MNLVFTTSVYQISNPDKQQLVSDVLSIFKDNQLYEELLEKCKVNSLLAYRCKELHELAVNGEKW